MPRTNIREYAEGMGVTITEANGRTVIRALNQGGYDCTMVDLQDVLDWVKEHGCSIEDEDE